MALTVVMTFSQCARHLRAPLRGAAVVLAVGFVMGAGGDENGGQGCVAFSESETPDFEGIWNVEYSDTLDLEITLGGVVHTATLGPQGGVVEIEHEGQPLSFDLECDRPEVVCPSEVWPETVEAEQRNEQFPHQVIMLLPRQECDGDLIAPADDACGDGTDNPDCEEICDGELVTRMQEAFGLLDEESENFELLLGGGVASNGINCALLGLSVARAEVVSNNPAARRGWQAEALTNGEVVTGYSGGCLWAGDPNMDGELEALVLGASVEIRTGFEAIREEG